jgi:ERCC4-type nuclease
VGRLQTYHGRRTGWQAIKGGMRTSEMHKKVLTLELRGGLHVRFTNSRDETCRFVHDLYRWFTDKAFDAHSSHVAVHRPLHLQRLSDFRETVARFPGVGAAVSLAVEMHFGASLRRAVCASVAEWATVQTTDATGHPRRLGTKTAEKIVAFCRGEA